MIEEHEISIDGTKLELVDKHIYLGQLNHKSGSLTPEIIRRIELPWAAFGPDSIMFKRRMSIDLKMKKYSEFMLLFMTLGCETRIVNMYITSKLRIAPNINRKVCARNHKKTSRKKGWIR